MSVSEKIESVLPNIPIDDLTKKIPAYVYEDSLTKEIVENLDELGWVVHYVKYFENESGSKNKTPVGKCILSFRQKDLELKVNDEIAPVINVYCHYDFLKKSIYDNYAVTTGFVHLEQSEASRLKSCILAMKKLKRKKIRQSLEKVVSIANGMELDKYQIPISGEKLDKFISDLIASRYTKRTVGQVRIEDIKTLSPSWNKDKKLNTLWDYYNNAQSWLIEGGMIWHPQKGSGYRYSDSRKARGVASTFLRKREVNLGLWKVLTSTYKKLK